MIELVLNLNTNTAHLRVDGRSDEQCNLDQIKLKQLIEQPNMRAAADYATASGWELCERCFMANHQ